MAENLKKAKVSDLTFDDKNFNKHTEYGMSLIEKASATMVPGALSSSTKTTALLPATEWLRLPPK